MFKKGKSKTMGIAFQGLESYVNPSSDVAKARNLGRIERLELKIKELRKKGLKNTERFKKLNRELHKRIKLKEFYEV